MNDKKKDLVLGIFSIIFISFITYLYFSKIDYIPLYTTNNEILEYKPKSHNSCYPHIDKPTVILRIDDIKAYSAASYALVNELLRQNLSATLGVIPSSVIKDKKMVEYLNDLKKNDGIEIAQHGTHHNESDKNINLEDLKQGNLILQKSIGIKPRTYIPPYNTISHESYALIVQYFDIVSRADKMLKGGDIAEIGQTIGTYSFQNNQTIDIQTIYASCKDSIKRTNTCVVTFHPQELADEKGTVINEKFDHFKEVLESLRSLNTTFSTFNDVVICSPD